MNNINLDLKNREWREFLMGDYFNVVLSKGDNQPRYLKSGKLPLISSGETENGLVMFIAQGDSKSEIFKKNTITFDMFGNCFVQPYDYYSVSHGRVNICIPKGQASFYALQFWATILNKEKNRFSYNNAAYSKVVARLKILLPVNSQGQPDYAFMEAYMKQKEQEKLKEYEQYILKRLDEVKDYEEVEGLGEKEWSEFEIGKLFILSQGKSKGLNHLTQTKKGINYLGATNLNNGVLCQVKEDRNLVHKGNAIAFIRNGEGSMGYSVYKMENFIATSDMSIAYSSNLNRYVGNFITTVSDKVRGKYNFGYKRSAKRLVKERIMLPINQKQEPDYEYMENYMKKLEYKAINRYLAYKLHNLKYANVPVRETAS